MWFCPLDGTLLQVLTPAASIDPSTGTADSGVTNSTFLCTTCPYRYVLSRNLVKRSPLPPSKKRSSAMTADDDDVLGGAAAWENVDRTKAVCPACFHGMAYFFQVQIRSADEPMSVFYKCCQCGHRWSDR